MDSYALIDILVEKTPRDYHTKFIKAILDVFKKYVEIFDYNFEDSNKLILMIDYDQNLFINKMKANFNINITLDF